MLRGCTASSSSSTGWANGRDELVRPAYVPERVSAVPTITLFVDPLTHHFERDALFDLARAPVSGDSILEPYVHLRHWLAERGVATHTADLLMRGEVGPSDVNVYVTMGMRTRYKRLARRGDVSLSAFFVPECPIADPLLFEQLYEVSGDFKRIYSFSDDAALRPFLRGPVSFRPFRYPYAFDDVHEEAWARSERGFLVMINGNKVPPLKTRELYTERLRAIAYFGARDEIDLYGIGWHGPSYRIGRTRMPGTVQMLQYRVDGLLDRLRPDPLLAAARRVWKGSVAVKADALSRYTFAICFENQILDGWVTEKIFDCLAAGTVPVYLGAPDIERWVAPECFVDMRRFSGYDELRAYLRDLSPAEIGAYREAGRAYFGSEQFRPFTKQAFAEIFGEILAEDAGVSL